MYYVYTLVDPRDNEVFYVGITISPERRFQSHLNDPETNPEKYARIQDIRQAGLSPLLVIIDMAETKSEARKIEKETIREYLAQKKSITNTAIPKTLSSGPVFIVQRKDAQDLLLEKKQKVIETLREELGEFVKERRSWRESIKWASRRRGLPQEIMLEVFRELQQEGWIKPERDEYTGQWVLRLWDLSEYYQPKPYLKGEQTII